MKILIERNSPNDFECLIEQNQNNQKDYYISGPFLQSEIKNRNKRLYPKAVMMKEVDRYINEKLHDNQAVGELGHPDNPTINLDRVSHKILSLTEDGNNWIGKAKIIDTPFGKIVKNLMDEKIKFGVSSRALGSLKENQGVNYVQDDFYIVTPADIVSEPSAPQAWVEAIYEGKEWAFGENGKLIEVIKDDAMNQINKASKSSSGLNEFKLLMIFEDILSKIGNPY